MTSFSRSVASDHCSASLDNARERRKVARKVTVHCGDGGHLENLG